MSRNVTFATWPQNPAQPSRRLEINFRSEFSLASFPRGDFLRPGCCLNSKPLSPGTIDTSKNMCRRVISFFEDFGFDLILSYPQFPFPF
jgi:hypothetical protein